MKAVAETLHDGDIDVRFFTDERKGKKKGIRLTEDLFKLSEQYQYRNLPAEVEARWRSIQRTTSMSWSEAATHCGK